ncbi:MAG: riboflavin synthase [Gemmatimonadota bacterium]
MFTGIIEEVGTITDISDLGNGRGFRIAATETLEALKLGESVAIDGACHTATAVHDDAFEVQSVATTLQRTTFGGLEVGRRVNLERAMKLGDRLGGHMVQGHVDAIGEIRAIEPRDEHVLIDFTLPPIVEEVTILHGSITVNGVSLTVNALPGPGLAQVSIIPHTWAVTALADLAAGSSVNLEGDVIGKYVRQLLEGRR